MQYSESDWVLRSSVLTIQWDKQKRKQTFKSKKQEGLDVPRQHEG